VPPVPPVNPVLYLLAMDGSGTTFVDDGPDHLTVSRVGGIGDTIEQNSDVTLFGLPTGYINRISTATTYAGLQWTNPAKTCLPTDDYCIEWFIYPINGTVIETMHMLQHALLWLPGNNSSFGNTFGNGGNTRCYVNIGGIPSSGSISTPNNSWSYLAMQYLASDNQVYCSCNGSLVATLNAQPVSNASSFRGRVFTNLPGAGSGRLYSARMAQVRGTLANLYGSSAAPVPTGPWPKF